MLRALLCARYKHVSCVSWRDVTEQVAIKLLKGGVRDTAAPGPVILGARDWLEWNIFMYSIYLP